MIVLKVIPKRFTSAEAATLADPAGTGKSSKPFVRRPTRGIQVKEDTFATLRLVAAVNGKNQRLIDAGSRRTDASGAPLEWKGKRATDVYSNFILQSVQEERVEKQQILETFGAPYIFFFGERPRVQTFTGVLLNTFDFNWEAEWWENYEQFLRGTRCVENDARVFISYDQTIVGGYILGTSSTKVAQDQNYVQFSFQLFVTSYSNFSALGDPSADPSVQALSAADFKTSSSYTLTETAAEVYRPKLLADYDVQNGPVTGNGQAKTLLEGLETGIAKVKSAWNQVDRAVNSTLNTVSGALNGDLGVRVPVGFAGSMEFDVEDVIDYQKVQYGGTMKYTVFSDNDDEYVGVGDHYGSASPQLLRWFGYNDLLGELAYGNSLVKLATTTWEANGVSIPETSLGPVSRFLVSKSAGLLAIGAGTLVQKGEQKLQDKISGTASCPVLSAGSGSAPPGYEVHSAVPTGGAFAHQAVPAGG